ncbi:hypothetical protein [Modicisalibacter sp. MOD 31.J]|uniref:hypothetical protein n=1 Tax=Modicisalibacter sp. MOD 31.J TaxID=2831897 RepID=UPI001CD017BC|nr:hypothetical protein [Modicisalibacter sp. MOD 31.J]MBZ9574389.1 hypothetical protein [Modicisalibacter sp. MOD 31.J]
MTRYPDETLAYYADRFVLLGLARHDITLEQYLASPERTEGLARYRALRMHRHGITWGQYLADPQYCEARALDPEPPSPEQHGAILRLWAHQDTGLAVAPQPVPAPVESPWTESWQDVLERCRAEVDHLPQRNGAIVEPLHHHRFNRRNNCHFSKRGA